MPAERPPAETGPLTSRDRSYRRHQRGVLGLATLAYFASAPGQSFLIAVFVDDFIAGAGLTRTTFSLLYAAGTVVSALAMLGLGRLIDTRGLRTAWAVVSLLLSGACALASLATGALVAFVALALLRTSGQGSFTLVGTLLVARSFERRRGQAMAFAQLGLMTASVLLPPLVALLIVNVGWRAAYQVIAVLLVLLVLPFSLAVRTGPPRDHPRGSPRAAPTGVHPAFRPVGRRGRVVPTRRTTRLLLVLSTPPLVGTALVFHAVSLLGERDIGYLEAGTVVGLVGLTSAGGVVGAGVLVDRLSTRHALLVASCMLTAATVALLHPSTVAAYVGYAVLGVAMGSNGVLTSTLWAREFGTTGLGRLQGTAQSATITAAAVAPLVPAISIATAGSYVPALGALAVLAALAAVVALGTRPLPRDGSPAGPDGPDGRGGGIRTRG